MVAGPDPEILRLQFQYHRAAGEVRFLQPGRHLFRQGAKHRHQVGGAGQVGVEGGFGRYALRITVRRHAAVVLAARQMIKPVAHGAVAAQQVAAFHLLQLADAADAVLFQRGRERLADAPDHGHRLPGQEVRRLCLADDREAARLAQVRRYLGQELAIGEADRGGDADLLFHRADEARQHQRRRQAVQLFRAAEVEERLVDGDRFDQRRQRLHHRADLPPDAGVFLHVRLDDDGVGAGFQRLEHRHRRTDAVDAGDVAGRRAHAALAAADDDRLVLQFRIVALFHRRVEGVAVDMGEVQPVEFGMADQPGAAAALATAGRATLKGQAVAAETVSGIVDRGCHGLRT